MYGVSGPFWYGAGATFQIFMFALAGECFLHQKKKRREMVCTQGRCRKYCNGSCK